MYLYIAIIIFATIFASCSVNPRFLKKGRSINMQLFIASFLVLWFFSVFRIVGKDYYDYGNVFLYSNTDQLYRYGVNMEAGFVFLNQIIRFFTDNFSVFVFIISTITLILVYNTINYFRDKIDVGLAVFIYSGLYYFQSYNLMRYYLAVAIILYAFRFLFEKRNIKFFICVVVAFFIHRASFGILLPFFILLTFRRNKLISVGILIAFVAICFYGLNYIQSINVIDRYNGYVENINFIGFRLGNIAIAIPILLIYTYTYFQKTVDSYLLDLFLLFILSALTYTFIGYAISIFGRMQTLFSCQYILFIPYMLKSLKKNKKDQMLIKALTNIYIVILIWNYFTILLYSSGIMPYASVFFKLS